MPWPDSGLPLVVEIAPGAAPAADPAGWSWVDVTGPVRIEGGVTIEQGRGDWGTDTDPGSVALTFDNTTGDFSEHNPAGQWFGRLGKNTPLRARLRRAEDDFTRTTAPGWGIAPSGHTWEIFGAGGSILPADASVAAGVGILSVPQANAYRAAWLPGLSLRDAEVLVTTGGPGIADTTGGGIEPVAVLLRMGDLLTYYMARVEVDVNQAATIRLYGPTGQLATAAAPFTYTGQPIALRAGIVGQQLYARAWDVAGAEPTGWQVSAVDTSAAALTRPGGIGLRAGVGAGNTNAKPVPFRFDSLRVFVDLAGGFVPAWISESDLSGKVRTVPVTGNGVLYRHKPGQSTPPVLSPWRRMVMSRARSGLLAYWPGEDDVSATQAASARPGGAPAFATGAAAFATYADGFFGSGEGKPGTAGGNRAINVDQGAVTGAVPAGSSSPIRWAVSWVARPVNSVSAPYPMMRWETPGGSIVRWEYRHANNTSQSGLWGIQAAGGELLFAQLFDDTPRMIEYRVEAWQDTPNGAGLRFYVDGAKVLDNFFTLTLARVTQVVANPNLTNIDALAVAHIQVWDHENPPRLGVASVTSTLQPVDGYGVKVFPYQRWNNETAHDRLARLCAEDGIPLAVPPVDAALAVRMGPQPDAPALDLYRECVAADGGILYERGFALAYRTRQSLYNQSPALILDARNDLATAPTPDGTDQRYRNRWTLGRAGGSSVVAEAAEVAAGALAYDESADVSLATDAQLPDHAGWRLHFTAATGLRWPRLELDLLARPDLLDAWLSCRIGDRITAEHVPDDVVGQGIDVLLEGYSLTLGYKDFRVVANCSPAAGWQTGTWDAGTVRYDTNGSQLAAPYTAGVDTTMTVVTTAGQTWTTTQEPFDINVGGARVTVTAISGATSPQTFTVTAPAVNGVTATYPAGTPVRVWAPTVYAL